jgi:hypothetical protein
MSLRPFSRSSRRQQAQRFCQPPAAPWRAATTAAISAVAHDPAVGERQLPRPTDGLPPDSARRGEGLMTAGYRTATC